MSMFESLKQEALSHIPGGDNAMVQAVVSGIEQQGGLLALSQRFHEKGLGGVIGSWISTGPNQPVSSDQIQAVLGHGRIAEIASRFGLPPDIVADKVAQLLPELVDKMTPGGSLQG